MTTTLQENIPNDNILDDNIPDDNTPDDNARFGVRFSAFFTSGSDIPNENSGVGVGGGSREEGVGRRE
jgi:hypothetical protein